MRTYQKPEAARQLEARQRARKVGARIYERVRGKHYYARSRTRQGIIYNIDRSAAGWECECEGYEFTGFCYHLGALERRSEREGWQFGKVAARRPAVVSPAPAEYVDPETGEILTPAPIPAAPKPAPDPALGLHLLMGGTPETFGKE